MALPAVVFGLAQAAPMILRWLGGNKAGEAAEKAIDVAPNTMREPRQAAPEE